MLNFCSGFRGVRVLVAACRDVQFTRDIGVCLSRHADGLHLAAQQHADDQREDARRKRDDGKGAPRAAADGRAGGGKREKFVAAGEEAIDTVCPVVGAEVVEEVVFEFFLPVLVEGVFGARTVEEGGKLTVIHAQKQDDAVAVCALAEFIGVIDLPGGFIGAVVVVFVVVDCDDVDADAIVLRNILGVGLQLDVLRLGQDA